MKYLVAWLLTLLFSCTANSAGYTIPTDVFIRAWSDAVRAADLPKKYTPRPPLTMWEPKWVVEEYCEENEAGEEECGGYRILGYYQNALVVKRHGEIRLKEKVVLLISWEEHKMCPLLLHELLVHEFLHYLHLRKAILDEDFVEAHPDEHEWIDEVYEFESSCWWEEDDEEEDGDSADGPDASAGPVVGDATCPVGPRNEPHPEF